MQRRKFQRLQLEADAYAADEQGRQLGRVSLVGGGGMRIHDVPEAAAADLKPGRRLRLTVLEPESRNSHTLDVVVRYRRGGYVGVEFLSGKDAAS